MRRYSEIGLRLSLLGLLALPSCGPGAHGGETADNGQVGTSSVSASNCSIAAGASASNNRLNCVNNIYVVTDASIAKLIDSVSKENNGLKQKNRELEIALRALQAQEGITRQQLVVALQSAGEYLQEGKSPADRFNRVVSRFRHLQSLLAAVSADSALARSLKGEAQLLLNAGDLDGTRAKIADLELRRSMYPTGGPPPTVRAPNVAAPDEIKIDTNAWLQNQYGNWVNISLDNRAVKLVAFGPLRSKCPGNFGILLNSWLNFGRVFDLQAYYVTFDPEDDPLALLQFASSTAMPMQILRGDSARIRAITRQMAVFYRKVPDGSYEMSTIVYVFDRQNRYVGIITVSDPASDVIKVMKDANRSSLRERDSKSWFDAIWNFFASPAHAESVAEVAISFEDLTEAGQDFTTYKKLHPRPCTKAPMLLAR